MSKRTYALKREPFFLCPGNRTSYDAKDAIRFPTKAAAQAKADARNKKRSDLNQLHVVIIEEAT